MVSETGEKYRQLLSELALLDEEHIPDLNSPDQRLILISAEMESLKKALTDYVFDNDAQEILFYKKTLPDMLSLYIYYTEKSGLEMSEIIGTRKSRTEYRNRLMKRIDDFATDNAALYDYYSLRQINFDSHYFLRSSPLNREPAVLFGTVIDCRFCPGTSLKMAKISAYRRLDAGLNESMKDVNTKAELSSVAGALLWTGTKRDLTELIYGLKKYINNGMTPIKEIVHGFQKLFNIDLGNYPRVYQEILARKKGDNFFLNQLVIDQQRRIEENENERLKKRGFK